MSVTERDALNTECLLEHNRLRALHGCLPLKFDSELASQARMHAEDVIGQTQFEHEQSNDYGENLALRTGKEKCILTGKQATLLWYSEIADYDFDQENQLSCGHFSQIVWKSTTHAGFGKARSSDGSKTVVVGVYMPPANFENEWCENVPPPLSGQLYLPSKKEICGTPEQHKKVIEKEKPENHTPEEKVIIITRPTENHSSERNRQKIILVRENASKRTTTNSNRNTVIEQTTEIVSLQPSEELNCTKAAKVTEIIQNGCESDTFEVQTWYDVVTGTVIEDIGKLAILRPIKSEQLLLEAFQIEVLHTQNRYRESHGVPSLKKNRELDRLAQSWAEELYNAEKLSYSNWEYNSRPLGEIVSCRTWKNSRISGEVLVSKWYHESQSYDYTREPDSSTRSGWFTQLIWKDSRELGVGFIPSREPDSVIIVCFYFPTGNVKGKFVDNVLPPI